MTSLEPQTTAKVIIETTKGVIEIELWAKEIPHITRRFIQNCLEKKYIGDTFGKIIKDYIIQSKSSDNKSSYDLNDEFHSRIRFNKKGLLCALKRDVKKKNGNSADSFFITMKEAPEFSNIYVIFGKIVGDSIYTLMKINNSDLNSNEEPIYPTKILDIKVPIKYFDDLSVTKSVIKDIPPKKKEKKDKKRKITLSYDIEDEGTEVVESNKKFKMRSAHELLTDKKLSKVPKLNNNPTETCYVINDENKDLNGDNRTMDYSEIENKDKELNNDIKNNVRHTIDPTAVDDSEDFGLQTQKENTKLNSKLEYDSDYDSNLDLSDNDIDLKTMMKHKFS